MIKIGTRGSKLALWQAYYVQKLLNGGGFDTQIVLIDTKGDQILDRSLSKIGSKGVFTQELEDQLRDARIDIAVHSAKDLQSDLADDLELLAFTTRERVNDVLVSFNKNRSVNSGESFVIGTSSTRRIALLKHYYPHIQTVDMRGNLQTRLRKLEEGQCDALLLAFAGVHRMEYDDLIAEYLPIEQFTPAVGQGSVAIECSTGLEQSKKERIKVLLNDPETEKCLLAERAFLNELQGGCSVPVFGLATLSGDSLSMTGGVVSLDGKRLLRETQIANTLDYASLGRQLAQKLIEVGAGEILAEIKRG
jgi:hydroxymethylbilane synthase